MKLIDEKIKALGLTKGQYCEKYGFKFKDFAAKVHTLEAKIEWANNFLKPLGLSARVLPTDSAEAVQFFLAQQLSERMADEEVRFLGGETPPEVKGTAGSYECERCGEEASLVFGQAPLVCAAPNANRTNGICGGEIRPKRQDDAESLL